MTLGTSQIRKNRGCLGISTLLLLSQSWEFSLPSSPSLVVREAVFPSELAMQGG